MNSSCSSSTTMTGMAIVPVLIKTKESQSVVETYAFLASGSNTSFCAESLLEKLNAKGKQTKLTLTTLQGEENSAECSLVSLQISDLLQENTVKLPEVYTRPNLPIPAEAIATKQDMNLIERPAITGAGPNQLPCWCPFKIQGGANRLNVRYQSNVPSSPSSSK